MSDSSKAGLRYAIDLLVLFTAYVATAKLGLRFDALAGVATTVWPPTGIALAAVCLRGRRVWPAIFLAALTVNAATGIPLWTTLVIAVGNTLESVVAGELLRALRWQRDLERVQDVLGFAVIALVATTVSATLGTLAVWLAHIPVKDGYGLFWMVWWVGDVLGALLVAPAMFAWSKSWRPSARVRRWIEGALLVAAVALVSATVFYDLFPHKNVRLARGTYSIWPVLIWAVVRFRLRGATLALLLVSLIAISGTASGHGLFAGGTVVPTAHERLFRVQCFMAVTAVSMMCLAAALAERRQAILARDEFISIASHELKTPLTALQLRLSTALRLLREDKAPLSVESVDRSTRALAAASVTTERLGRLIDDLLDVSRLTASRLELNVEDIDLGDMLNDLAGRLRDQATAVGSAISVAIDEDRGAEDRGAEDRGAEDRGGIVGCWDRGRIEQVLTNLLSNAIKYGAGKGITLEARADADRVIIAVRDGGIGIAKGDHERIFRAFERVDTHHRVGGLGLGLYIGRQIVAAHGGTLRVVSALGRGSTFVLDLPRAARPRAGRSAREA